MRSRRHAEPRRLSTPISLGRCYAAWKCMVWDARKAALQLFMIWSSLTVCQFLCAKSTRFVACKEMTPAGRPISLINMQLPFSKSHQSPIISLSSPLQAFFLIFFPLPKSSWEIWGICKLPVNGLSRRISRPGRFWSHIFGLGRKSAAVCGCSWSGMVLVGPYVPIWYTGESASK